jgi:hypothetical protein
MGCPCCAGPRPWDAALRGRGGLRDRLFARLMRGGAAKYNQLLGERKRALFSEIGWGADVRDLLEVGIGSAPNAEFLSANKVQFSLLRMQ